MTVNVPRNIHFMNYYIFSNIFFFYVLAPWLYILDILYELPCIAPIHIRIQSPGHGPRPHPHPHPHPHRPRSRRMFANWI